MMSAPGRQQAGGNGRNLHGAWRVAGAAAPHRNQQEHDEAKRSGRSWMVAVRLCGISASAYFPERVAVAPAQHPNGDEEIHQAEGNALQIEHAVFLYHRHPVRDALLADIDVVVGKRGRIAPAKIIDGAGGGDEQGENSREDEESPPDKRLPEPQYGRAMPVS